MDGYEEGGEGGRKGGWEIEGKKRGQEREKGGRQDEGRENNWGKELLGGHYTQYWIHNAFTYMFI